MFLLNNGKVDTLLKYNCNILYIYIMYFTSSSIVELKNVYTFIFFHP